MKKLSTLILVIIFSFMIFAGPAAPPAHGIVISTVVIGSVIAAMAAAGIGLAVSGMTSSQLTDWVSGKLNDWTSSIGGSIEDHINGNLITTTARGTLAIGNAAASGISTFISWLRNDLRLSDQNAVSVISPSNSDLITASWTQCTDGYVTFAYMQTDNFLTPAYAFYQNANDEYSSGVVIVSEGKPQIIGKRYFSNPNNSDQWDATPGQYDITTNLWYYKGYWTGTINLGIRPLVTEFKTLKEGLAYIRYGIDNGFDIAGESLTVVTGTIDIPYIGTDDNWYIDVGADAGDDVDTVTSGIIDDTMDNTLTVSSEVAEEEPPVVVDGPIGITGLTSVFPFCIPFDVYALLSCLEADPQTPIFNVNFVIPGVINQQLTIDLTPFNSIAQIVRTLELLAFAVGLAMVTRDRFLRS